MSIYNRELSWVTGSSIVQIFRELIGLPGMDLVLHASSNPNAWVFCVYKPRMVPNL